MEGRAAKFRGRAKVRAGADGDAIDQRAALEWRSLPLRRGRIQRRDYVLRRLLVFADAVAIGAAALFAFLVVGNTRINLALPALVAIPLWILVFKVYGLYEGDAKRISHTTIDDIPQLFHAVMVGALALWGVYRGLTSYHFVFSEVVSFVLAVFLGVLALRFVARHLATRLASCERVLIVGTGPTAAVLARKIAGHPEYGLEAVGYLDEGPGDEALAGVSERLGEVADLIRVCTSHHIERVVIVSGALSQDTITHLVRSTKDIAVRLSLIPHAFEVLGPAVALDHIEGMAVLGVNPPALMRSSRVLKRAMDVVVASLLLLLTLPAMVVAALAVKLTSPGPIFYIQRRLGRGGRPFGMVKLRTMVVDAEERAKELAPMSSHHAWLLLDNDPRITKVGRILRRASIDELPQLWNVLKGDMSLVGPRPMPADIYTHIEEWGRRRLDLTPGITGLWQVLGRTSIPFEEMVKLDYVYVTNWSLWEDIRLLLRTLPAVLGRRGAN